MPVSASYRPAPRWPALGEGFFVEFRELWSDGELVALNQQTFAMIR